MIWLGLGLSRLARGYSGNMEIESYRQRLEEFEGKLNWELYRFYAGQKDELEIVCVYSDYSDLFSLDAIRETEAEARKTLESFPSRSRSLDKIAGFLIDQHLDFRAAPLTRDLTHLEAKLKVQWEGRELAFHSIRSQLRKEPDAFKRRELNARFCRTLEDADSLQVERISELQASAVRLGFRGYPEARERIAGLKYERLLESFDAVFRPLQDTYFECLRLSMETTMGIPFQETGSWDVPYWEKRNDAEHVFPANRLMSVAEATISEMGIRPERSESISYDLTPVQSRGPICIPIRVPHEIKIVMQPESGSAYYAALLHESGHACHFAWTSPTLPFEHRIWGDRAISEAYAFLLEHCLLEPGWLTRMLSFGRFSDFIHFQSLSRLMSIYRCAGKLRLVLRVQWQSSLDDIPRTYSETMKADTGLNHSPEMWSFDLSDGFSSADYLRGWALEAMLRDYLKTKYGSSWQLSRAAAGFLKEIWETGLLYRADELCREIGIGDLSFQVLADELREGLKD
jgi:hypothetical protein